VSFRFYGPLGDFLTSGQRGRRQLPGPASVKDVVESVGVPLARHQRPAERGRHGQYRLFVAMALPDDVKDAIERAQRQLRAAVPGRVVRWTKRGQFHLTLRFLGNVEVARVDEVTVSIRSACAGFGALQLRAGQIGFFPDARRPRVVWVGVTDGRGRLADLHRAVEAATAGFTGEAPEPRFSGHVTLGRCRMAKRSQAGILSTLARALEHTQFGEWTADHVELIRSEPLPEGSRYTTLASIPLTPS
jgi:2'-5' RNA ligase